MNGSNVMVEAEYPIIDQSDAFLIADDRSEFVEAPARRTSAGRGLITGVMLGATVWGAILVFTGVVKL